MKESSFIKKAAMSSTLAAALSITSWTAQAVIINEISPDAGELLGTAQDTTGGLTIGSPGVSLDSISGSLINLGTDTTPVDDIDLYKILITDPGAFSVTVAADLSDDDDAILWLFDAAGVMVLSDDDDGLGHLPQFNAGELTDPPNAPGMYFLAFNLFATTPANYFILDPPNLDDGWNRDPLPFQTGPYTLSLTGVETVPIPASVWLFGSGLLGLIGISRRKKAT